MSTAQATETRVRSILLGDALDVETVLQLRHLAQQYRSEKQELQAALNDLASKQIEGKAERLTAAYWALGQNDEALQHAGKASGSAIATLIRGCIAEEAGNLEEALSLFRKAAEQAPSSPPCVLRQLGAMCELGQVDEALALIEKLRREFSDKADLHYYEGRCRELQGEIQEALDCFLRGIEANPKHARCIFAAANLADLRGLDDEAKSLYKKVGPGAGDVYVHACLNLALLYDDSGDHDSAMACCQKVLDVQPNNRRAKLFLSNAQASSTMYYSPEETKQSERLEAVLRVPVSDFELSVRSRNCLANMNIQSLGDLVRKTESEMLAYKNFGETSLREIKEMLASRGLRLGIMREDAATRAAMERARASANQELLSKPIDELELGVRARKCMDSLGIRTIGELASKSELDLAHAKNFGRVSLNEIKKRLAEVGLSLRDAK